MTANEKILEQLKEIFNGEFELTMIHSLHDEDGPDMEMIIYNGLIIANPEYGLEVAARNVLAIKLEEENKRWQESI